MTKTTDLDSPDTLPPVGFTRLQLARYIRRQLGDPVWVVELTEQQVLDAVQDALNKINVWRPKVGYGSLALVRGQTIYLKGQDIGDVVQVDFVDSIPAPTEIFYGNLISPAPLLRAGLDEYDSFLRWRKTWTRCTSVMCDWMYDPNAKALYIHNPVERYHAGVITHQRHADTSTLDFVSADWAKEYALSKARYTYGEILSKFSGAIPAPVAGLQLDQRKRDEAKEKLKELDDHLRSMQLSTTWIID